MRRPRAKSCRESRRSFTLVEMLVVITIIGLISSSVLFALWGAMEQAREERTRSQIARLNELLMNRYEEYRTRAVPIAVPASVRSNLAATAGLRLTSLRELMRMELPDRRTDVIHGTQVLGASPLPAVSAYPPSLWINYNRRVIAVHGRGWQTQPANDPTRTWTTQHQGAECLYMIVAGMRDGDRSALDYFSENEIGDTDNDGMLEILDGWGNPIEFLRWAPGFRSDVQPGDTDPADGNAGAAPDVFDMFKLDARWIDGDGTNDPYALYPLVFSAGPDGLYDIVTDDPSSPLNYSAPPHPVIRNPSGTPATFTVRYDPYVTLSGGGQVGDRLDANGDGDLSFRDNITNHSLGTP